MPLQLARMREHTHLQNFPSASFRLFSMENSYTCLIRVWMTSYVKSFSSFLRFSLRQCKQLIYKSLSQCVINRTLCDSSSTKSEIEQPKASEIASSTWMVGLLDFSYIMFCNVARLMPAFLLKAVRVKLPCSMRDTIFCLIVIEPLRVV